MVPPQQRKGPSISRGAHSWICRKFLHAGLALDTAQAARPYDALAADSPPFQVGVQALLAQHRVLTREVSEMAKFFPQFRSVRTGNLLVCVVLVACSPPAKGAEEASGDKGSSDRATSASQASEQATPSAALPSPSPTQQPAPLKIPERVASGAVTENGGGWNKAVQRITYLSSADSTRQRMMFYRPPTDGPRPLLVGLHSWSEGYTQDESAIYAEWAIANDCVFIHPHFRGPNVRPQATGSELVIADVLSAIDYAKANAGVDDRRIYAVGWSGGGHLGLLLAGRHPDIWRACQHGCRSRI